MARKRRRRAAVGQGVRGTGMTAKLADAAPSPPTSLPICPIYDAADS